MKRDTEHMFTVLQRPHLSEKTVSAAGEKGLYVFRVAETATKADVKHAVETIFEKGVSKVRIVNVKGKPKRFGGISGRTKSWKKAYVTFVDGGQIDLETLKV